MFVDSGLHPAAGIDVATDAVLGCVQGHQIHVRSFEKYVHGGVETAVDSGRIGHQTDPQPFELRTQHYTFWQAIPAGIHKTGKVIQQMPDVSARLKALELLGKRYRLFSEPAAEPGADELRVTVRVVDQLEREPPG